MVEKRREELEKRFKRSRDAGGVYDQGVHLFYSRMLLAVFRLIGEKSPELVEQVLSDLEKDEELLREILPTSPGYLESVLQGFQGELGEVRRQLAADRAESEAE